MIHNRTAALIFRIGCFIFVLFGLLAHTNIFTGELNFRQFMYYTIQSNILALLLFGLLALRTATGLIRNGKDGSAGYFAGFEMVCVIDLLLTLIVYWVMLAPGAFAMAGELDMWGFGNLAVHLVTPLLCVVDYVLFTDAKHLKYRDVWYVLLYPLLYVAYSSIAGLLGYVYREDSLTGRPVRFPYFFFDWDQIGLLSLQYIGVLVLFFLAISHLLFLVDRRWKKPVLAPRQQPAVEAVTKEAV